MPGNLMSTNTTSGFSRGKRFTASSPAAQALTKRNPLGGADAPAQKLAIPIVIFN